jgi:hypothetical protein
MALLAVHQVVIDDGTNPALTLAEGTTRAYTVAWEPHPLISSLFQADDGTSIKQVNASAAQKYRITISGGGECPSGLHGLDYESTWSVTIADLDDPSATKNWATLWPVDPPTEDRAMNAAKNTWRVVLQER